MKPRSSARESCSELKTDAETIDRAIDEVISERERSARAWAATESFIKSRVVIKDVLDG